MEHWIGYYAAFYGAFIMVMVAHAVNMADADEINIGVWKAVIFTLPPLPLILHAWGVL